MWPRLFSSTFALALALVPVVLASPLEKRSQSRLAIDADFPDPAFIQVPDGSWYAFGSNGNGKRIQVAQSLDFITWTLLDAEALPTTAGWETEVDHWAPDVIMRVSGLHTCIFIPPQIL